jgi:hypothetical protein
VCVVEQLREYGSATSSASLTTVRVYIEQKKQSLKV